MKKVILKKEALEKITLYNPWIYNREIKDIPKDVKSGEVVEIVSHRGDFLGIGYINPKSKITVRVLTFEKEDIDIQFFVKRIKKAVEKREEIFKTSNGVRIIHSEADGLAGLIADYYDGYISLQINTAGMENFRDTILESLIEVLKPKAIVEKSDSKSRLVEGLETEEKVLYGEVPGSIVIVENGVKFKIDLITGQKTGFYLDQRANREKVSKYVKKGFKVLDLFSNTGGFGIYTALKGAEFVKFVDISENAVSLIYENLKLNNIDNFEIKRADVFDFVKEELKSGLKYDIIVLDPPPFAKSKNEKEGALRGFKYLILNSLKLLNENGYLAVFSCSHHITYEDLINTTLDSLKDTKTKAQYIEYLTQDTDHPYIINIPSTLYLKGFILQKVR
ncbi:MAG: class I SAM-dependent rRNA methyltransferase [Hydrogenothermaceae bacterium]